MKNINFLVFLLIAFSFIIVIGIGHGIAPIIFFEIILIPFLLDSSTLAAENVYMLAFTSVGFVGHVCLCVGIFSKKRRIKHNLTLTGISFLLLFVLYFAIFYSENSSPALTLISSIPLIFTTVIILYYLFRPNSHNSAIKIIENQ